MPTIPGLPTRPCFYDIDLDPETEQVNGLFWSGALHLKGGDNEPTRQLFRHRFDCPCAAARCRRGTSASPEPLNDWWAEDGSHLHPGLLFVAVFLFLHILYNVWPKSFKCVPGQWLGSYCGRRLCQSDPLVEPDQLVRQLMFERWHVYTNRLSFLRFLFFKEVIHNDWSWTSLTLNALHQFAFSLTVWNVIPNFQSEWLNKVSSDQSHIWRLPAVVFTVSDATFRYPSGKN